MFKEEQGIGREARLGELEASANELKLQPGPISARTGDGDGR